MIEAQPGRLARDLEHRGFRALLVLATSSRDPDLAPFVGEVHLGESFVLVTPDDRLRLGYLTAMERQEAAASGCQLLDPDKLNTAELRRSSRSEADFWQAVVVRALEISGVPSGPIAVAGRFPAGLALEVCRGLQGCGWTCAAGDEMVRLFRKRKSKAQIESARQAAAGVAEALREVASMLAAAVSREGELWLEGERLKVARLRRAISERLATRELEQPQGNIVTAGCDAAVPHTQGPSSRVLREHESIVVDLYPRRSLFADCTRTFCVGDPPTELAAAHAAVTDALRRSQRRAVPGQRGWDLQRATCEFFSAEGYPTPLTHPRTTSGYVHGLGHGVGFELHEYPSFRETAGSEGMLETGDVFTLEPGLYDPEAGWGVRIEDLCSLSDGGLVNLTPVPYALDPRAWDAG